MGVAKSAIAFATGTFLSRITGLIREREMGAVFGSGVLDIFMIAYRIPNLFRDMLAEGALGASFTKVYAAQSATDKNKADQLMLQSLIVTTLLAILVSFLGILTSSFWLKLNTLMGVSSKQSPNFYADCLKLTKLLFPYLGMTMICAVLQGALQKNGKMFLCAISPIALNLGFIFGAWHFSRYFADPDSRMFSNWLAEPGLFGLTIGVLLGSFLQLAWQVWGLRHEIQGVFKRKFVFQLWNSEMKQMILLMTPMIIAASSAQINVMINTNFAITLEKGAVTWLTFAFRLLHLPVGIFGVAVGSAVLPPLAKAVALAQKRITTDISDQLQTAVELILWVMVPSFIFMYLNAEALIDLIYQKGAFNHRDVLATSEALQAYSFSIIGYGLIKVLTPFYYAIEKTSYAMKVSLIGIAINIGANLLLVNTIGFKGIGYAMSILLSVNATQLFWQTRKEGVSWNINKLHKTTVALVMGCLFSWLMHQLVHYFIFNLLVRPSPKLNFVLEILLSGSCTLVIFLIAAMILFGWSISQLISNIKLFFKRGA